MEARPKNEHRVLVIDDEPIVCKSLKLALGRSGFAVEAFEDPTLALNRFDEAHFDIVVTDVVMGDVDGIQVLNYVKKKTPNVKVIIMTAFAYMHLARDAMERGAFDFIAKPFTAEDIREIVVRAATELPARGAP
jgi:DNA-binding NtrC family response regulator